MGRHRPVMALIATVLLGGCVYDPYTGTYVPCCGYYGYPPYAYRYPPPYYPYGYPPPGQYGGPPPSNYQGPPPPAYQSSPGASAPVPSTRGSSLDQRFYAANVTHDGRLTRQQAETGMPLVAQNFDAIDIDQKGYVTLPEIRAFAARSRSGGA